MYFRSTKFYSRPCSRINVHIHITPTAKSSLVFSVRSCNAMKTYMHTCAELCELTCNASFYNVFILLCKLPISIISVFLSWLILNILRNLIMNTSQLEYHGVIIYLVLFPALELKIARSFIYKIALPGSQNYFLLYN